MKRSLYDSEYDRVRRDAGYTKPRYEFEGLDVEIDAAAAEREKQEFRARMAEAELAEKKRLEELEERHRQRRLEGDRRLLLWEYERLGLMPLEPLISLGLALSLGWRIEQIGDRNTLVKPENRPSAVRRREDYERTEGT
jgi:CRISPR/Cas system-associated protein Cas5 (RAMP superfamily)